MTELDSKSRRRWTVVISLWLTATVLFYSSGVVIPGVVNAVRQDEYGTGPTLEIDTNLYARVEVKSTLRGWCLPLLMSVQKTGKPYRVGVTVLGRGGDLTRTKIVVRDLSVRTRNGWRELDIDDVSASFEPYTGG